MTEITIKDIIMVSIGVLIFTVLSFIRYPRPFSTFIVDWIVGTIFGVIFYSILRSKTDELERAYKCKRKDES